MLRILAILVCSSFAIFFAALAARRVFAAVALNTPPGTLQTAAAGAGAWSQVALLVFGVLVSSFLARLAFKS